MRRKKTPRKRSNIYWLASVLFALLATTAYGQLSGPSLEKNRRSVAKLRIHRDRLPDETASCVIVGAANQTFYCATALHAVDAKGPAPTMRRVTAVQLQVYGAPEQFEATINEQFDPALDLGVVRFTTSRLADHNLRMGTREPTIGITLHIVGHPPFGDWSAWQGTIRNENAGAGDTAHFVYTGNNVVEDGFSGGGVFDDKGAFLGIHTSSTQHYGIGLKAFDIKRALNSWQIPTNLLAKMRLETLNRVWRSPGLNVDCNRTNAGTLQASVPLDQQYDERVVAVVAAYENVDKIKGQTGPIVLGSPNPVVTVQYGFNGLDKDFVGNCPGGGHATVAVTFTIQREVLDN